MNKIFSGIKKNRIIGKKERKVRNNIEKLQNYAISVGATIVNTSQLNSENSFSSSYYQIRFSNFYMRALKKQIYDLCKNNAEINMSFEYSLDYIIFNHS